MIWSYYSSLDTYLSHCSLPNAHIPDTQIVCATIGMFAFMVYVSGIIFCTSPNSNSQNLSTFTMVMSSTLVTQSWINHLTPSVLIFSFMQQRDKSRYFLILCIELTSHTFLMVILSHTKDKACNWDCFLTICPHQVWAHYYLNKEVYIFHFF